jgi:hypothetical protein
MLAAFDAVFRFDGAPPTSRDMGQARVLIVEIAKELTRLSDVRRDRLARCAAESRRLSLEECCYWLCVLGRDWQMPALVRRDAHYMRKYRAEARASLREILRRRRRHIDDPWMVRICNENARRLAVVVWLCREALRRIEEERR